MKLIFLDIDGVLNNSYTKEKLWNGFTGVDKRLLKMFLDWHIKTDYQLVLSSTWRSGGDYMQELNDQGLFWKTVTPRTSIHGDRRGDEIQIILDQLKPDRYAILDDLEPSKFLKHQRPFLVQTSYVKGLEPKKLKKLDEILGT